MAAIDPLLAELLQPVSADGFCGSDPYHEPEFGLAADEVKKFSGRDYAAVEGACRTLLREKGKDLRALGYLALARGARDGWPALAIVITATARLAREHWPGIFPRSPAARANAFAFLAGDKVRLTLDAFEPARAEAGPLEAAIEAWRDWAEFVAANFPAGQAQVDSILRWLRARQARIPAPASKPPTSAVPAAEIPAPEIPADPLEWAQRAAFALLERDPADPVAYRLNRALKWGAMAAAPAAEERRTLLPAPHPATLEGLRALAANGDHATMVRQAEEAFTGGELVLSLDLQRLLRQSLLALGGNHAACARAVEEEVRSLLLRFPELANLEWQDGTPFADAETRTWIQGLVAPGGAGEGGPIPADAIAMEGEGDGAEGPAVLAQAGAEAGRAFFRRRLEAARACRRSGHVRTALGILRGLERMAEAHGLEAWEPAAAARVHRELYAVYRDLEGTEGAEWAARAMAALERLASVDPAAASRLEAGPAPM